jgi:phosphoribosyl 1,2-cyclic phosphodiesterase
MKIRFWGTRGSIPVSLTTADIRAKMIEAVQGARDRRLDHRADIEAYIDGLGFDIAGTYGGHSSCVQIDAGGDEFVVLDMGSGARPFGQSMIERFGPGKPQTYHIFMSHLHWDHIMGFPFFTPIYIPGNHIVVHSCHENVEYAFRRQQREPSFPVDFEQLGADIRFDVMQPDTPYTIAGLTVRAKLQRHAGDSYGWRFEHDGKSVIYTTDSEHRLEDQAECAAFVEFFANADAVIFDAMYSLADAISVKADWGHSSNIVGVELCQMARARRLVMFHHEPAYDDVRIEQVLGETRRFEEITRDGGHAVEVLSAWDGLELTL